jgi:uncharacterized protein (TIRG00374 family)
MAVFKTQRVAIAALGFLASLVFVSLAFRRVDFGSVVSVWRTAQLLPWLPLMVVAYLAGHVVRGQRLRVLLRREAVLQLATASNIVVVGYASNNVLPARLGEFVRAGIMSERTGVPLGQALTVTFIERLLDGIAILLLLLVSSHALGTRPLMIERVAGAASVILGFALLALLVAVFLPTLLVSTTSRASKVLPAKWRDRLLALATSVTNAGACLRRPRDAALIVGYSVAVWLLESMMFAFAYPVFSLKLALAPAIVTMSVTNLGLLVPSSPGFIGSFHYFCSSTLALQGVATATAASFAILVHLAFFLPVTLWGAGAISWYGIEVGSAAALARAAKSAPGAALVQGVPVHVIARLEPVAPPGPPPEFLVALTEALLAGPDAAPEAKDVIAVAAFLAESIDALPPRLRALFEAGMATFRLYTRLRFFRSFCALEVARRSAAVQAWAFGPVGLFRQLFRPVRSIVFLSYYERVTPAEGPRAPLPLMAAAFAAKPHA